MNWLEAATDRLGVFVKAIDCRVFERLHQCGSLVQIPRLAKGWYFRVHLLLQWHTIAQAIAWVIGWPLTPCTTPLFSARAAHPGGGSRPADLTGRSGCTISQLLVNSAAIRVRAPNFSWFSCFHQKWEHASHNALGTYFVEGRMLKDLWTGWNDRVASRSTLGWSNLLE